MRPADVAARFGASCPPHGCCPRDPGARARRAAAASLGAGAGFMLIAGLVVGLVVVVLSLLVRLRQRIRRSLARVDVDEAPTPV